MYGWKCTAQLVCDADLSSNSTPFEQLNRPEQTNQAQIGAVQTFLNAISPSSVRVRNYCLHKLLMGFVHGWVWDWMSFKGPSNPNLSRIPCHQQIKPVSAFLLPSCVQKKPGSVLIVQSFDVFAQKTHPHKTSPLSITPPFPPHLPAAHWACTLFQKEKSSRVLLMKDK